MNQSMLIRCAAAALAAVAFLPAQSAPVNPPNVAAGPQGPAKASVQTRLTEVIELLAREDLSPEQRADAKKMLEEIAAQLRRQGDAPAAASRPRRAPVAVDGHQDPDAVAAPAKAAKPPKAPKPQKTTKPGAFEVAPGEPMEPPEPSEAPQVRRPRAFRSVEAQGVGEPAEIVEVTPEGERSMGTATARRRWEQESQAHVKAAEQARAEAEKAAQAGRLKATRARDHARKAEADAMEHAEHTKMRRAQQDPEAKGADTWVLRPSRRKVELNGGEGEGDAEIRAVIEEMRREMREIRELMQQLREKAQDRATGQGGAGYGRPGQMGMGMSGSLAPVNSRSRFDPQSGGMGGQPGVRTGYGK